MNLDHVLAGSNVWNGLSVAKIRARTRGARGTFPSHVENRVHGVPFGGWDLGLRQRQASFRGRASRFRGRVSREWDRQTWNVLPAFAAMGGNRSEVERLIAEGADVNEQLVEDVDGRGDLAGTPLHVAIRYCAQDDPSLYRGHHEVVKVLLAAGADVRLRRTWEGTPLHDAARAGWIHIAELLISYGADINSKEDFERRTPLHFAAAHGRLAMADYLLSRGADIDAVSDWVDPSPLGCIRIPTDTRMTPLQLAAREGHVAMVKRLIDAGVSLDVSRAIDLAAGSKRKSDTRFDEITALLSSGSSDARFTIECWWHDHNNRAAGLRSAALPFDA